MSSTPFRAGLQIPSFNLPGAEPADLLERLTAIAHTAESSGFDALYVMDHLHQIRGVGPEEHWMLEGPTTLAALAGRTSRIHLGLMVGGITYRNPALLAKITTTIDVLSGGRAILGIGAAWNDSEHLAYGYAFPPLKERFERLEDGLQIFHAMFTEERATVHGTHHSVEQAYNNPKPLRGDIPTLIGGSGEKKTLRMVAQYADASNVFGDVEKIKHLMGVLDAHCADVGRDPFEIARTKLATLLIGDTHEAAEAKADALREHMPADMFDRIVLCGDRDGLAEQIAAHRAAGLTGLIVNMPEVHDLEQVQAAGAILATALS
ncbi:F420-dependent glucose-6-phosphate dehydrogenase [Baekduia alba]|uniref:LLM class F420-dependent oxidoreductase n=1 Tax=Baekduia alba TaxID=2997333 RepID=UPI0023420DDF|nr:LLM class F420-dependent oxidoreductase [Baekduia alba]WCB96396.1 F420-dependent glucose-6-phosphate dehydrogenase [Baekduia alba]